VCVRGRVCVCVLYGYCYTNISVRILLYGHHNKDAVKQILCFREVLHIIFLVSIILSDRCYTQ
jgi:hypothetical protein